MGCEIAIGVSDYLDANQFNLRLLFKTAIRLRTYGKAHELTCDKKIGLRSFLASTATLYDIETMSLFKNQFMNVLLVTSNQAR